MFKLKLVSTVLSVAVSLGAPLATYAATSWSSGTIYQSQAVKSQHKAANLSQSGSIWTSTTLGDDALAESKTTGSQSGTYVKGYQKQDLGASSQLNWDNNWWPTEVTAKTDGYANQKQNNWTWKPNMQQDAQLWQKSHVADNVSQLDVNGSQTISKGGPGDYQQKQKLNGSTGASGKVWLGEPCGSWNWNCNSPCNNTCSTPFGGKFIQDVSVFVHNIFEF